MPVKLVNETWKSRKRRGRPDHRELFHRMSPNQRVVHLLECGSCLESALAAVERVKTLAKEHGIVL